MTTTTSTARDRRRGGMTLARAKEKLRVIGYQIRKQDGEYQVKPEGRGSWATGKLVSYATDLDDAVSTAESQIRTYLSRGGGRYRVIHQSMPISPDKATAREALAAAEQFKLQVADVFWDGDADEFRPLSSEASRDRGKRRAGERSTRRARRDPGGRAVPSKIPKSIYHLRSSYPKYKKPSAKVLAGLKVARVVPQREREWLVEFEDGMGVNVHQGRSSSGKLSTVYHALAVHDRVRYYEEARPEPAQPLANAYQYVALTQIIPHESAFHVGESYRREGGNRHDLFAEVHDSHPALRDRSSRGASRSRRGTARRDVPRRPARIPMQRWSSLDPAERRELAEYERGDVDVYGISKKGNAREREQKAHEQALHWESEARTGKVHEGWGTIGTPRHAWGSAEKAHREAARFAREHGDEAAARRHEVAAAEAREMKQRTKVTQLEGFHKGRKSSARMRDPASRGTSRKPRGTSRAIARVHGPGEAYAAYYMLQKNTPQGWVDVWGSEDQAHLERLVKRAAETGKPPHRVIERPYRYDPRLVSAKRDPLPHGRSSKASAARAEPPEPRSGFGKEKTPADIRARIRWERFMAAKFRRNMAPLGYESLVEGHEHAARAYEDLLARPATRDPLPHGRSSKASPVRVERGGASQVAWHGKSPNFAPVTVVWNGPGSRLFLLWGKSMVPVQHRSADGNYSSFESADRAARAFIRGDK